MIAQLDQLLSDGLSAMAMGHWVEAQQILSERLGRTDQVGSRRLNLFLISIAAATGGREAEANEFWMQAQQTELDDTAIRYLDLQLSVGDPRQTMLIDLEKAWWDFNGWNANPNAPQAQAQETTIDWEFALECTLNGDCSELEGRYGNLFAESVRHHEILWNLLAVAYLQAGNVRTYEEMIGNAPPLPPPGSVPPELAQALSTRGLGEALKLLNEGHWINTVSLFDSADGSELQAPQESVSQEQWEQRMAEGFALLDLNKGIEATRHFQFLATNTEERKLTVIALNALALAFFQMGDYSQAESVYHEFRAVLDRNPVDPNSELMQKYGRWMESIGATPQGGQPFFSPFGTKSSWNEGALKDDVDFWDEMNRCLTALGEGDRMEAKRELQRLERAYSQPDAWQAYLMALAYLIGAVAEGDHFEVQEFEVELRELAPRAVFPPEELQNAGDALKWAGFPTAAARLSAGENGTPGPVDPWKDLIGSPSEQAF